ncbi:hypothetical protein N431DRAFT_408655 [Stipitochalara longipes BDJ]|nr:hypothetical protein N431DRAFT_408655 [Stipitochalara longipes BDJ]
MQELNRNSATTPFSRSSTLVNRSVSIDSFETVVPTLLGPDKISDPDNAELDVWFVHGLTGNRKKTWTHENGVFWPELLAKDYPKARVITYGYDANVVNFAKDWANASTEGLKSYGQGLAYAVRNELQSKTARPIYFIPHSLGGLVVEQALLESIGSDISLNNVAQWTAGILFFGVPHQGSHLAKWGSALRKLIPESIRSTNKKVIDALKNESEVCQNLDEDFQKETKHGKLSKIRLFSFYETRKLPLFKNLVVPESSAVLKADFKCAIEGDHKSMTRFTGPNDPEYCKVKGQLSSWLLPENTAVAQPPAPKKKKKSRTRMNVQGATISGDFHAPVYAQSMFAARDFNAALGPYSTQSIHYGGSQADQRDSDEYGEPSSSESDSDEGEDTDKEE